MTIFEFLKLRAKEALRKWDNYNYFVSGPMSFDDDNKIRVTLKNQDKSRIEIWILVEITLPVEIKYFDRNGMEIKSQFEAEG